MTDLPKLEFRMTLKGKAAECINAALDQGFQDFKEIIPYSSKMNSQPDRLIIHTDYSNEYVRTAHDWLTSKPNPMIIEYEIRRAGY